VSTAVHKTAHAIHPGVTDFSSSAFFPRSSYDMVLQSILLLADKVGLALDRDVASHNLTEAPADGEAKAGAASGLGGLGEV
jgi:hypothetical protein